jgi:tRNA-dihydrouridine synthase
VAHELFGAAAPVVPTDDALVQMVQDHYRKSLAFYGEHLGARVIRKHLGWYMDHAGTTPDLRRKTLSSRDPNEVLDLIPMSLLESEAA